MLLTEQVDILYGKFFKLRILLPHHPHSLWAPRPGDWVHQSDEAVAPDTSSPCPPLWPSDITRHQWNSLMTSACVLPAPRRPTLSWGPLSLSLGSPPAWLSLLRGYHDITQIQSTYSHRCELINFILLLFKYMQTEVSQFCAFQRVCSGSRENRLHTWPLLGCCGRKGWVSLKQVNNRKTLLSINV